MVKNEAKQPEASRTSIANPTAPCGVRAARKSSRWGVVAAPVGASRSLCDPVGGLRRRVGGRGGVSLQRRWRWQLFALRVQPRPGSAWIDRIEALGCELQAFKLRVASSCGLAK